MPLLSELLGLDYSHVPDWTMGVVRLLGTFLRVHVSVWPMGVALFLF